MDNGATKFAGANDQMSQRRTVAWIRLQPIGYNTIAAAIFLVGLALRLYRLGARSFWLDEVFTAQMVQYQSLAEAIRNVRADNAPLAYIVTWLLRGFGGGEWTVRLPYAIAGSLTVVAVYALGKALGRPRAALVGALLMAISPFSLWFAQDARPYAFLMFFTTMQFLFAYRVVQQSRLINWLGLILFSLLNLYTHYLALLVTGANFAFLGFAIAIELLTAISNRASAPAPGCHPHRIRTPRCEFHRWRLLSDVGYLPGDIPQPQGFGVWSRGRHTHRDPG